MEVLSNIGVLRYNFRYIVHDIALRHRLGRAYSRVNMARATNLPRLQVRASINRTERYISLISRRFIL